MMVYRSENLELSKIRKFQWTSSQIVGSANRPPVSIHSSGIGFLQHLSCSGGVTYNRFGYTDCVLSASYSIDCITAR
jgi:hypothetical protein